MPIDSHRRQIVQQLTQQLRAWERAHGTPPPAARAEQTQNEGIRSGSAAVHQITEDPGSSTPTLPASSPLPPPGLRISTGIPGLDQLLPGGGLEPGRLVEWLALGDGSGTEMLALLAAREALALRGMLVVVDGAGDFYPPAAALWGIDLERLILVRPARQADILWAVDQALRCAGVAAVLAGVGRLADRPFRRLQLAAEQGGGLGLLLRSGAFQKDPSWADITFLVTPLPVTEAGVDRRLCVEILRCQGGSHASRVNLEIDNETGLVHLVPERAPSVPIRRSARA